ncbi:hypothetical protein [Sporomusa aerivorans]|uniref:hypothetical protein n=1 Tax=Sporomusa aerivorans TaxID=204936 RepID=UPI00352B2D7D
MLPIQFALELETIIAGQLAKLIETTPAETAPVLTLLHQSQTEFTKLLTRAQTVDVDSAVYPPVTEAQLLGLDTSWQQINQKLKAGDLSLDGLTAYWSLYTAVDKTAQFYQQAAANSAHPQTQLFFSSLSHVKKILRRRFDGIIHIYYNHLWGELGFAPFILGKD